MTIASVNFSRYLAELAQVLVECFGGAELLRLLDRVFGAGVVADLPLTAESPRAQIHDIVRVLARRGLIDARLFAAFVQERPNRARDIHRLAAGLKVGIEIDPGERDTVVWRGEQSPHADRKGWVEAIEQHLLARERLDPNDPTRTELDKTVDGLARRIRAAPLLGAGSVVAGTRLDRPLGAGNFGTVWRAHNTSNGHVVATKIFHADRLTDGVMLWRFRRSIRALESLSGDRLAPPSIPKILAVSADKLAFVMPYFLGGTLEQIDRRGWSLATKLEVFLEVCRAVDFSHRRGVIHRDIKPANVLLDAASRPVLIDFDIADISFVTHLSIASGGLGTPVFAAPEQLEDAELADERSDIYSLGRLLHYMLLERSPGFQIERDPTLANLRGMPPALVSVVRKACQWDPQRRHASALLMIREIGAHQHGLAAFLAHLGNARRWIRGHAALLAICTTLVGTSTIIAGLESRLAASRGALLEYTERQLKQHEQKRDELAAALARFKDLRADVQGLVSTLNEAESQARDNPAIAMLRHTLELTARRLVILDADLVVVEGDILDKVSQLGRQQADLRRLLRGDPPIYDKYAVLADVEARDEAPRSTIIRPTSTPHEPRPAPPLVSGKPVPLTSGRASGLRSGPARRPRRPPRPKLSDHGDKAVLAAIKDAIVPHIKGCVINARGADKTARLVLTFTVGPKGHVLSPEFSRKLDGSTTTCISDAFKSVDYPSSKKGDKIRYVII